MSQKRHMGKKKAGALFPLLSLIVILGIVLIPKFIKLENVQGGREQILTFLFGTSPYDSYQAKSILLADCSNDSVFLSKREREKYPPASLAKLFVIEYAAELSELDSVVPARGEAIALTKPGSSVAGIKAKEYYLHNLFAAMLVPSGNDAAYVVADYCGGILSPQALTAQERVNVFMKKLNEHLREKGYQDTVLYDPSGFDTDAMTTALEVQTITEELLEYRWFRNIISQGFYTTTLPDGSTRTWKNTNEFLDSSSEYYDENVMGVKTGTLIDAYNLVVLYQKHGKEFIICTLGSPSDSSRYEEMRNILKTIDESDFLSR